MINSQLSSLVNDISIPIDHVNADFHSTFSPKKAWKIKDGTHETFWGGYCEIVQNITNGHDSGLLNVAEKILRYCPIIVDCVIKFQKGNSPGFNSSIWEENFISELIYAFQSAMNDVLLIESKSNDSEYLTLVMSESHLENDGSQIYSYRIQFPFCRIEPIIQKRLIKPKAIQFLRKRNVISIFPETPIGDWDAIISSGNMDEIVTLYGSVINSNKKPLSIIDKVYERITLEDIENKYIPYINLTEALEDFIIPKNHSHVGMGLVDINSPFLDMENIESKVNDINYYIPFILSINYSSICIRVKQNISINDMTPSSSRMYSTPNSYSQSSMINETDIDIAEKLLPLLSIERVNNEHYWLDVGKALYNSDITDGKEKAFRLWVAFTEKGEDRDRDECYQYWDSFSIENALTLKTIAWYARIDSPVDYERWHKSKYSPFLQKSLSCTHDDVSLAFYWIYWLDFVCGSVKNKTWYVFSKHILREADSGREIRTKIGTDFKSHYEVLQKEISDKILTTHNELEKTQHQMEIKKIGSLISKLKTVTYKNNIMTALLDWFKDDNFNKYANTNARLFGCANGIIECCDKYAIHRPGKPEDYVTMATTINYPKNHAWSDQGVMKFMIWLKQIFIQDDLLRYFHRLISSCLRSKNKEKILPTLSGAMGNNSKSMMKLLIETVFGPYSHTFPTYAFTKPQGTGASPEFAAAMFAKLGWVTEPSENAHLQADQIKSKTGMDKANDRMLYDNGGQYDIMYTLFIVCNKIPLIPGADNAIVNRLKVIPFDSVWTADAPDDVDEQYKLRKFKLDTEFESKIPYMAPSALWTFVETYREYCNKGLGQPAIVKKVTDKYFKENDLYKGFLEYAITRKVIPGSQTDSNPKGDLDTQYRVSLTELYSVFKQWVRVTYPSMKVPDSPVFLFHMNQRLGKPTKKEYLGYTLNDKLTAK